MYRSSVEHYDCDRNLGASINIDRVYAASFEQTRCCRTMMLVAFFLVGVCNSLLWSMLVVACAWVSGRFNFDDRIGVIYVGLATACLLAQGGHAFLETLAPRRPALLALIAFAAGAMALLVLISEMHGLLSLACVALMCGSVAFVEMVVLRSLAAFPESAICSWSSGTGVGALVGGVAYVVVRRTAGPAARVSMIAVGVCVAVYGVCFLFVGSNMWRAASIDKADMSCRNLKRCVRRTWMHLVQASASYFLAGLSVGILMNTSADRWVSSADASAVSGDGPFLINWPWIYRNTLATLATTFFAGVTVARSSACLCGLRNFVGLTVLQLGFCTLYWVHAVLFFLPFLIELAIVFSIGIWFGLLYINVLFDLGRQNGNRIAVADRSLATVLFGVSTTVGVIFFALVAASVPDLVPPKQTPSVEHIGHTVPNTLCTQYR
ncbi:hypothetical protein PBRA_005082 [Plasmodiophora brassicae]|uniref:Uncharacterized protein n=1 Tax=Plasmodiophora brassicae TaxID=37360 RepID=A0A0G4IME0_PLABS|nr:hypothetical protein PBRA_005082 [Plasmodiophora brassicae]